jgi:hypothetical protein
MLMMMMCYLDENSKGLLLRHLEQQGCDQERLTLKQKSITFKLTDTALAKSSVLMTNTLLH